MRLLLTIALLLLPAYARAAPITFAFTAGAMTGQYTFETTTPGVRQPATDPDATVFDGLRHINAITNFDLQFGGFAASGTGGDIELAINRGRFGESWYDVDIRIGPISHLSIFFFSPSAASFIASEDLTALPPNHRVPDVFRTVTLSNDTPSGPADILFSSFDTAVITPIGEPPTTSVPEPSSALLFGVGLIAAAARRFRSS